MTNVVIQNGQTLFDIALQYCGDISAAYDIAVINDIEITSNLVVGEEINIPDVINKNVVNYYQQNEIKPSTAIMFNPL